jgi:3',5'-cyclic AMP phosphodiesterase CpdA
MTKQSVIHLSDLHVGLRQQESVRTHRIVEAIGNSLAGIPVLVTGDMTDSATTDEFREARGLMDQLAKTNPILMIPGNHDYAWKGNVYRPGAWKDWLKYLGSPLGWGRPEATWLEKSHDPVGVDGLGVWKQDPLVFFGIDSGDPNDKVICARGYISDKLATGLKRALQENEGKTRIVFLHHHPFTEGFFTGLAGAGLLLSAVKDNCEILLFGHDHNYGIWRNREGIPLIVASHKSTARVSGDCVMITVLDIEEPGTPNLSIHHRLEVVYDN